MGFRIKNEIQTDVDFGETSLENIFIKHFLPFADEDQIKVYILGLYYAKHEKETTISSLANELDIPESRVMSALEHWEKNDLLTIEKTEEGFGAAFYSVRSRVFAGKILPSSKRNISELAEALIPIIGKPLSSTEFHFYEHFVMNEPENMEILKNVLTLYYKDFKKTDFSEVRRFLELINKQQSQSIEEILILANNFFTRNSLYRRIKIMIGGKATATPAEQTKINSWLDKYHMSESEIIRFVEEHSPSSNNPTVGYIDRLIGQQREITEEERSRSELLKKFKFEITGSRYAVNAKEKKMMLAWMEELKMTEEDIMEAIHAHSATQRGATVSFMDEKIRGGKNIPEPKRTLKVKNKKNSVEELVDEDLLLLIKNREENNRNGSQ